MQVLIVDDDAFALSVLESTLARFGYTAVAARDGVEAMHILQRGEIRLMVTDWEMPGMNGLDLCRAVRRQDLPGYVYVIMLTGREGPKQRLAGLYAGADDFLNKPLDPEELLVCLKTAERILSLETREVALFALAKLAESRDSDTGAHIERLQAYTRILARNLSHEMKARHGVDDEYIRLLFQTSPLHDLGKVGIPDAVLLKPGKLSADEQVIMKTHTVIGAQTLDSALQRFPNVRFLQMARDIALSHHEKFDGSGYPQGLVGEQIPLCARIVALVDVYDVLTSRRIYKEPVSHERAKQILLKERNSHFDPEVVDAFVRAEAEILAARTRLSDDSVHAAAPQAIVTPPNPEQPSASQGTVLVVDDDPVILNRLAELLGATGQNILQAHSGEEAMKLAVEHIPKVIISDWVMPGMDGVALCQNIRFHADAEPVHFIMLTAHSDKARLLDAYRAGVDDFISKPFDAEELLARVRAGLRSTSLHAELVAKASGSRSLNAQLATMNSRLERLSVTDELTGLFNRRYGMARSEEQWSFAERYGNPLTVAMIDIDHFKNINDSFGHDAGDVILRRVAGFLQDETRGTDTVCRFGGEEFLIIFPLQTTREAYVCVERCRKAVESHNFVVRGASVAVTISIGLAERTPGMAQFTDLLKVGDEMLYAAKHSGRNNIQISDTGKESHTMNPSNSSANLPASTPPQGKPPIDIDAVLKRCGGDVKFAAAITDKFRSQAPIEVNRVQTALATKDADTLRRSAHSLKSMAAYIGDDLATDIARKIESMGQANQFAEAAPLVLSLKERIDLAAAWIENNNGAFAAKVA